MLETLHGEKISIKFLSLHLSVFQLDCPVPNFIYPSKFHSSKSIISGENSSLDVSNFVLNYIKKDNASQHIFSNLFVNEFAASFSPLKCQYDGDAKFD